MDSFEDLEWHPTPSSLTASSIEDGGSAIQTQRITAATPGGPELFNHQSSYLLYPTLNGYSLARPYSSVSTRAGPNDFTNTGYTPWNETNWNDDSQQAPHLTSFHTHSLAEAFAHTPSPSLDQWHPGQGEHSIHTQWHHHSPYLHPSRSQPMYASALQTAPGAHGSDYINHRPLPLPADPDSAPPPELANNSNVMIGSICATSSPDVYVFKCHGAKCASLTFGRWYDFRRHYNGAHAAAPTVYWCDFEGCPRSRGAGDRPFTRKDKVKDHFESMHKEEVEAGE